MTKQTSSTSSKCWRTSTQRISRSTSDGAESESGDKTLSSLSEETSEPPWQSSTPSSTTRLWRVVTRNWTSSTVTRCHLKNKNKLCSNLSKTAPSPKKLENLSPLSSV